MPALIAWLAAAVATAAAAVGVYMLRRRIAVVSVIGQSMQPTLAPGDRVLVRRASIGEIRVGQIIVIEKPGGGGVWTTGSLRGDAGRREWMIKRVAAIPGDPGPDTMPATGTGDGAGAETSAGAGQVVPAGKLVVLGDNPARSMDSRQIGYIPADRVLGIVLRSMHHAARATQGGHPAVHQHARDAGAVRASDVRSG